MSFWCLFKHKWIYSDWHEFETPNGNRSSILATTRACMRCGLVQECHQLGHYDIPLWYNTSYLGDKK